MDWQLIDHGMDGAQYFPGVGVVGSIYQHAVTGVGDSYLGALDDALEQMREEGAAEAVLDEIEKQYRPTIVEPNDWRLRSVHEACEQEYLAMLAPWSSQCGFERWHEQQECEIGYYVSIRWRAGTK